MPSATRPMSARQNRATQRPCRNRRMNGNRRTRMNRLTIIPSRVKMKAHRKNLLQSASKPAHTVIRRPHWAQARKRMTAIRRRSVSRRWRKDTTARHWACRRVHLKKNRRQSVIGRTPARNSQRLSAPIPLCTKKAA